MNVEVQEETTAISPNPATPVEVVDGSRAKAILNNLKAQREVFTQKLKISSDHSRKKKKAKVDDCCSANRKHNKHVEKKAKTMCGLDKKLKGLGPTNKNANDIGSECGTLPTIEMSESSKYSDEVCDVDEKHDPLLISESCCSKEETIPEHTEFRARVLVDEMKERREALGRVLRAVSTRDSTQSRCDGSASTTPTEATSSVGSLQHDSDLYGVSGSIGELSDIEDDVEAPFDLSRLTPEEVDIPFHLREGMRLSIENAEKSRKSSPPFERSSRRSNRLRELYGHHPFPRRLESEYRNSKTTVRSREEFNKQILQAFKQQHSGAMRKRSAISRHSKSARDGTRGAALVRSTELRQVFFSKMQADIDELKRLSAKAKPRKPQRKRRCSNDVSASDSSSSAAFTNDTGTSGWLSGSEYVESLLSASNASTLNISRTLSSWSDIVDSEDDVVDASSSTEDSKPLFIPEQWSDRRCGAVGGMYFLSQA